MDQDRTVCETPALENDRPRAPAADVARGTWVTPDFVEESACAEICAYVFNA